MPSTDVTERRNRARDFLRMSKPVGQNARQVVLFARFLEVVTRYGVRVAVNVGHIKEIRCRAASISGEDVVTAIIGDNIDIETHTPMSEILSIVGGAFNNV